MTPGVHLSIHEAVRYIDRTADPLTLARLERHLAECHVCLSEVVEVTLFLHHHMSAFQQPLQGDSL